MNVLTTIQSELKAPKGQYNSFAKYYYRSCEDILEAVKPLLVKHEATLTVSDEVVSIGDRFYVKATATLFSAKDGSFTVSAYAREPDSKKGSDESQITGAASSYARKYALNGLFLIDDAKDADTDEHRAESSRPSQKPQATSGGTKPTKEHVSEMAKWNDGTFSKDELAAIKNNLQSPGWLKVFEDTKKEYERRKNVLGNIENKEDIY